MRLTHCHVAALLLVCLAPRDCLAQDPETAAQHASLGTVIIDAGHGGKDPGAVNRWGVREKDVNLAVALLLRDYVEGESDIPVVMTRDTDMYLTLDERTELANDYVGNEAGRQPSVFVSIHCNAAANIHAVGAETYVYNTTATDRRAARVAARENLGQDFSLDFIFADMRKRAIADLTEQFAVRVQDELVAGAHVADRDVRGGPFYVLFFSAMPSVLVELGFLTNRDEQARLATVAGQRALAQAIGVAVLAFGANDLDAWQEAAGHDE
ncbi:N-acetylmuramoyl-L-alanine amidase [Candidatus Poribacteria bacterium]|nr:N-acetylmuramoyl-L-alanine amidase [Candidatus Poribacteria bacterium]MBT5536477.1 N-acetylmuramoyl-L-alanine amidase [Candidatus Poribacteria bacterium]MBT5714888.1 N-acetylmuramoyl-L-alanine amidase [Candidatus Poribacteria bacterium]MBT7100157.1 N-acetylmuramoyl-L-alanine amidase [Candidatus Poribacteria bacterium]MBT7806709.1 N-acetylmuramoyl-L-alanine amidase [Candidatus Poribacteria bacterium]